MLPGRSSGVHGTPVPKRDVELKSRGSGPVITYKLSPEELQQYLHHLASPENKKTPFVFPKPKKSDQEKEEAAVAELTREEYLRLRLEGMGRAAIQREHFRNNATKFYRTLKEWGIREKEDEEKELERLRSEQPAADSRVERTDPYQEAASKMFSQPPQQNPLKDEINRLREELAIKNLRIKELEHTVSQLETERDSLLRVVEKAVDDNSGSAQDEHDPINRPSHYTAGKVECIDAIEAATVGLTGGAAYCTGNAIKYLWRWSRKGGVEDLRKARWYIDRLIEEAAK